MEVNDMGSPIEINDTLKISKERGFPKELNLEEYVRNPELSSEKVAGKQFSFWNEGERLYHRSPTRVFLVEEIEGKWLYWGHARIKEQTIKENRTEGLFEIIKLYSPEYQKLATNNESPKGKSYFATNKS